MQKYFDEEEIRLREQISELLADEWSWVKDPVSLNNLFYIISIFIILTL